MEPLEALKELERKFGRRASTLRELLKNDEKVDPSLAIALLRKELGVKVIPYGSVVLGVPDPGDIDGYVHPGDRKVVERVKLLIYSLTGLTPSLRPLERRSVIPNTVAGKVERLALKASQMGAYRPLRFSKLERDANHLKTIAEKASGNELLTHLYAIELIDHLRRRGLTNEQILEKFQRYRRIPEVLDRIKKRYPSVFTFIEEIIDKAAGLLRKGEAL